MKFEPVFQLKVLLHPSAPRIQNDDRESQRRAPQQVLFHQLFPLSRLFFRNFRESISWEIDEAVTTVDLEEVGRLRAARPRTRACQPAGPYQSINEAGFADIAPA